MAHPSYLREKARTLRAQRRLTIDELERLALSRSTIYYWVRDMPIPGSGPGGGFSTAGQRKGTRAMKRKYRLLPTTRCFTLECRRGWIKPANRGGRLARTGRGAVW
jgi:hypothetical protein